MIIRFIAHDSPAYHAALRLREAVLRVPLGLSIADDDLSAEKDQIHITVADEDLTLLGCVVLKPADNHTVQMRQLAVAASARGRGIGRALVTAAEDHVRNRLGAALLFCHARQDVIPFYEKLGYQAKGDIFTEVTIPHRHMEKRL